MMGLPPHSDRHGFRRCDKPKPLKLGGARPASWVGLVDGDAQKIGRVFVLGIKASGDLGCTARCWVCAGSFSRAAVKPRIQLFRYPVLQVIFGHILRV
jgi:hypothetical protein